MPHYLAVFWPWLGDSPGDVIGGAVPILVFAVIASVAPKLSLTATVAPSEPA